MQAARDAYLRAFAKAQAVLDQANNAMNGIIISRAMDGEVGQAITQEINNSHKAILVGLKDSMTVFTGEFQKTLSDFTSTVGESSESAVLDEDTLTQAEDGLSRLQTGHHEQEQKFQQIYHSIDDLISLNDPPSQFDEISDQAKKQLDQTIQNVHRFDQQPAPSNAAPLLEALCQHIEAARQASELSYTDPAFGQFVNQSDFADLINDLDAQIVQAEKAAQLEAEQAAKTAQEAWGRQHPVESCLQSMSASISGWWAQVVQGTRALPAWTEGLKDNLLMLEGFVGTAGETVSALAIGSSQLVHLGMELGQWGVDSLRGVQTAQWKLDDLHNAWDKTKAMGKTLGTIGLGVQELTNPWLLVVSPAHHRAAKQTFDLGAHMVKKVVHDVKNGDAYAMGGYLFDIASLFIGAGEVNAGLKGAQAVSKLTEGVNAFKLTAKVDTLSKWDKVVDVLSHATKYGDEAAQRLVGKIRNIPVPGMEKEFALAGMGSDVKMGSKTLGDVLDQAKAQMSFARDESAGQDILKAGKPDEVKDVAKGVEKASGAKNDVLRLDEVEVTFKRKLEHNPEEFTRQLKNQEIGMNQLTVENYLKNRESYLNNGRSSEANITQKTVRQEALSNKIWELQSQGISLKEAELQANEWLKNQAALHNPDMIAGGNPLNIQGLGDKGINSSLGSQWRYRIDEVDKKIVELSKNMTPEQLKNTYIKVRLVE